ncbi:MAG TPA: glycosyltransferase family 4 protein [Bacteroidia bacterium]|nr:glycosyltransferase family 4 protein [Bacteroidia bacterium]
MKRVLIVTYYWPPGGGAGVQRWVKLSKYFVKQGVIPYVVTVDPTKASYAILDPTMEEDVAKEVKVVRTSTLEPYGIYKTLLRKKEIPFGGFANEEKQQPKLTQRIARFIRGNLFLPDARRGWNRFAYKKCCELIEKENIDAVITTSPPHSTQLIGLKLKRKYDLPWLADLRDPWTDIYYYEKLLLTSFSRTRDKKMEKEVLENAGAVVVVSEDIRKTLLSKSNKLPVEKFHVIPNGFDADDFKTVQAEQKENAFVISYTGTLTDDYRLDGFLEAIKKLNESPLRLHITGSLPQPIRAKIENAAPGKTRFRSHVSHHEAIAQMKAADLLLLVIPDTKGNKGILTGKLFEYLATFKPILCIGPHGDAARIIATCISGKTFSYDDVNGIASYLEEVIAQWKPHHKTSAGVPEIVNQFSREKQATQVLKVMEMIRERG